MKPFVLVEIEDGSESDSHVVGTNDVVAIVIDWDAAEEDPDVASEAVKEIWGRYSPGEYPDKEVLEILGRLQGIPSDEDDDDEDEDEDFDFAIDEDDDGLDDRDRMTRASD